MNIRQPAAVTVWRGAAMKKTAMEQCMWQMIAEKRKGTYFECCDIIQTAGRQGGVENEVIKLV